MTVTSRPSTKGSSEPGPGRDEQTGGADDLALDQWYPLAALAEITPHRRSITMLLDRDVEYAVDEQGRPRAWSDSGAELSVRDDYGYLWTCLGRPPDGLFHDPAVDEPDRRLMNSCTFGILTSAPRAVENFLDMAHLPIVHAGLLGEMPYSEIIDYGLEVTDDEVLATKCWIYQPMASAASTEGMMVDYTFKVVHPTCAFLYKSSPGYEERLDVVGLFCQPVRSDFVRVHLWDARLDEVNTTTQVRRFGQTIIAQDKPVLENQLPKELPLSGEVPVRSDKTGAAYRRWLYDMGWTYGVIRD